MEKKKKKDSVVENKKKRWEDDLKSKVWTTNTGFGLNKV